MFEAWFNAFFEQGGEVFIDTSPTTGDNGTPAKDLGYLLKKVVTNDNKLRIVVSS